MFKINTNVALYICGSVNIKALFSGLRERKDFRLGIKDFGPASFCSVFIPNCCCKYACRIEYTAGILRFQDNICS